MASAAKKAKTGDLPAWYKEMEKDLECPVCLESFLDPPIYVCENQHGLCSTCRKNLVDQKKSCPVCSGKLTDKRNRIVEKMLEKLPGTKCVYPECTFKRANPKAAMDHKEDCIHRRAPCVICEEPVPMSRLNNHLTTHGRKVMPPPEHDNAETFVIPYNWQGVFMLKVPPDTPIRGVSFYLNSVGYHDNNMMLWVSYNGPKKDRYKYQFQMDLFGDKDGNHIAMSCTKYCVPCDVPLSDIKEKHLGVFINKELAKKVSFNDAEFKFKVTAEFFITP